MFKNRGKVRSHQILFLGYNCWVFFLFYYRQFQSWTTKTCQIQPSLFLTLGTKLFIVEEGASDSWLNEKMSTITLKSPVQTAIVSRLGVVLKVVEGPLRISETIFRGPWHQSISIIVPDALCLLHSLLPRLCSWVFQKLHDSRGYHHSEANGICVGIFLCFKNSSL